MGAMPSAKVTSQGQITIPAEVRRALSITPGTQVIFVLHEDGLCELIVKSRSITELSGMVKYDGPPISIEEMDEAIAEGAAETMRS